MNKMLILPIIAIAFMVISGPSLARDHYRHGYADSRYYSQSPRSHRRQFNNRRVNRSRRINRRVDRRCRSNGDLDGAVAGGLIGGIIGNSVAGRGDRAALTIVGALVGGLVGQEIADDRRRGRRCR